MRVGAKPVEGFAFTETDGRVLSPTADAVAAARITADASADNRPAAEVENLMAHAPGDR